MPTVCEPYIRRRAVRHLEKGRVVIFAAGTGNPFFTTDTAAALRAAEMSCDALLKGTRSTASTRPTRKKDPNAKRYEHAQLRWTCCRSDLKVMDASAIALARDNSIPIIVFDIHEPGTSRDVLAGEGTLHHHRRGARAER